MRILKAGTCPAVHALVWMGLSSLCGQTFKPGPQVVTFFSDVDDSDQPYALYMPRQFDPVKKYPLVISLHDAESNHRLNLRRVFGQSNRPTESDWEASRYWPAFKDVDFIVACPLARGTLGYQGIAEKDVYDVVNDVKKRVPIDEDRIYLTGPEMGGGGALWLGLTRPDVWAAIAPVCALAPPETDELAPNALNLPVRLFHGELDPAVPVEASRKWRQELLRLGSPVEYTEYPGVRHNSWDYAYNNGAVFDWFNGFRRNRFPARVRFVTEHYKYASAYWVRLDGLQPGTLASIDARFAAPNQIAVETRNVRGFTLGLAGHPLYSKNKPLSIAIAGQKLRATASLAFTRTPGGWRAGRYTIPEGQKKLGAEGPLAEASASRQIYVYGTAGSPTIEETLGRRQEALRAASWSSARNRLMLTFRVLSDKEVREPDLQNANLILFGTRATNELIQRWSDRLPIALNASAADYGLVFVYPMGAHYVVVNSGVPWWTGTEEAGRAVRPFPPPRYRMLLSFGDYLLFKGSLENVVAQGRFTDDWRIPEADLQKMKAAGAIETK